MTLPLASWTLVLTFLAAGPVPLTGPGGDDRYPAFSPDGTRLLFESNHHGDWELYTMVVGGRASGATDAEGGEPTRLTESPAGDRFAAWMPAGDRIAFQSDRGGRPELYVLFAASGRVVPLGVAGGAEMVPGVASDGSAIAFTAEARGNVDLYLFQLNEGGQPQRLTRHRRRDVWPRFSPDGESVVFFSRRDTSGEDDELYVLGLAGGKPRRITERAGHDFCPSFAPDGRSLIAAGRNPEGTERFLTVFAIDGTEIGRLGEGFDRVTHPSWSPTGDRIAFTARTAPDADYDVYVETLPKELRAPAAASTGCCAESRRQAWLGACASLIAPGTPASDVGFHRETGLAEAFVDACEAALETSAGTRAFFAELASAACCARSERTAWLASCEDDARRVRVGMRLAEIAEDFQFDGGLSLLDERRLVHRRCLYLKLRVRFEPGDTAHATPTGRHDVLTEVFGPYVGPLYVD